MRLSLHSVKCSLLLIGFLSYSWSSWGQIGDIWLIDSRIDAPLYQLENGSTVDLGTVGDRLNIEALADSGLYSVQFGLNEVARVRNELTAPYALVGDFEGDFFDWTPELGTNVLTITPYLTKNQPGTPKVISFNVIDSRQGPRPSDGDGAVRVDGTLRKWHKITIEASGPYHREDDNQANPFLDYRMEVLFRQGGRTFKVPGYFAADGEAADSGANAGTIWKAHFRPETTGTWTYELSFRQGPGAAVSADSLPGDPHPLLDGRQGSFEVGPNDKAAPDLRAAGRLEYVGKRYLQFSETRTLFLKGGPDSPENFLAYEEFDNTSNFKKYRKNYAPHLDDWKENDPTWRDQRGKGIIGAINYLASKGMNAFSFLTFSYGGDDRNVYPHLYPEIDFLHFDCSKLDQWERVFEHASSKGMYLHFKMQEKENDQFFDGGELGPERRLYLREMIARFGHHLALNWNIGEENDQTDEQRIAIAEYLRQIDPYDHHIVVHAVPKDNDLIYTPLLGEQSELTGMSLQSPYKSVHELTRTWLARSEAAGKIWVVANDEQGPSNIGVPVDSDYPGSSNTEPSTRDIREQVLWGNLMAGGAGVEYYFGYDLPDSDLSLQNYRSRDRSWESVKHALDFFHTYLPFDQMQSADELVNRGYCFAQKGIMYAVYRPTDGTYRLTLPDATTYQLSWYDPRNGGALQTGEITELQGPGAVDLGRPPSAISQDWVALVSLNNLPPVAQLSANPTTGTAPLDVTFDGSSSTDSDGRIVAFRWNFGNGQTAVGQTKTHQYELPGTYTAELIVQDDDGSTDTAHQQIQVLAPNLPPTARLLASPIRGTAPLEVTLDAGNSSDPENAITAYLWDFGDGGSASGATAIHTFTTPGVFQVRLIVTDEGGLADTTFQSITVLAPNRAPTARIQATPIAGTAPLCVTFNGSGSSDPDGRLIAYRWAFGNGDTANGQELKHCYDQPGTYTVELTVQDNDGSTDTAFQQIEVRAPNLPPTARLGASPVQGTAPLEVTLDAGNSSDPENAITDYQWDFGEGNTATGVSVTHTFSTVGTFQVQLTVVDAEGLTDATSQSITVIAPNRAPSARMQVQPSTGPAPLCATFNGSNSSDPDGNLVAYRWRFGDGETASGREVTHCYNQPGTYTALLEVEDNEGSRATVTQRIVVGPALPPLLAGIEVSTTQGDAPITIYFDAASSQGAISSFQWWIGSELRGFSEHYEHLFLRPGHYQVSLVVVDSFEQVDTATVSIEISAAGPTAPDLFMPSFSYSLPTPPFAPFSVPHLGSDGAMRLYPNPASDVVQIQLPSGTKEGLLRLHNLSGQLVGQLAVSNDFIRWELPSLPSGLYWIEYLSNRGRMVQQLIID